MVLGYSRIKFVKATSNRDQRTLFSCMIDAFQYFGGIPREILFDNLKTVIDRSKTTNRLTVYNCKFENYVELENIVESFMEEINNEVSQATGKIPLDLFSKDKEYFKPLLSLDVLCSYVYLEKEYKVTKESMSNYKGKKYSVPIKYIGLKLNVTETSDGNISIYYNKDFIICHSLSNNKYNYKSGHMYEILKSDAYKHLSDNQINDFIKENIALMDI